MATENIDIILDKLQARLDILKANKKNLQYFEDHGDGGFWRDLTEEKAAQFANDDWDLCDFQVGELFFLVATPDGIKIVSETEKALLPQFNVLYQGSKQACKNFIKVD